MKSNKSILKMVLAALFLALAFVIPFLTGQIPEIGAMLCPMHIPVLLCGFICGPYYGLAVGFISPLMRSFILGMPPPFPSAVCMAFELAAYGALSGLMYKILPKRRPFIYLSLFISMLVGRFVWGCAMFICMGLSDSSFGFAAFIAGAFTNSVPGIIAQAILVPLIIMALENTKYIDKGKNCEQ